MQGNTKWFWLQQILAGLFPSTWLRVCVQWSIRREALISGPLWPQILKMKGFSFICLLPPFGIFLAALFCLASAIASFLKKPHVCKPGFVSYGKPTAGGSHRLGSCWNHQRLLEKRILLWGSHYMSELCEMRFPWLCMHFYMDFVMGWTGLAHIQVVPSSRRELLPTFSSLPLPVAKLWLWTDVSVTIYQVVERERKTGCRWRTGNSAERRMRKESRRKRSRKWENKEPALKINT